MEILYFAWVRDRVGIAKESVDLADEVKTVADLVAWLKKKSSRHTEAFADLSLIRVAVNQEHVPLSHPVASDDEVAFFPPMTGGAR